MWVLFATTINHGLRWTKSNLWVASLAGLLGGPMAFFGGMNLGAVEFSHTAAALVVIGLGWALLLPVLTLVADTIIDSTVLEPVDDRDSSTQRRKLTHLELGYE
jgi:Na+/H+ antiporter NhaC